MIDLDHLTTLTDAEARDLLAAVYAEVQRRDAIAKAPAQAEALATRYAAAIGRKDGDPYQPVTGAHDAYPPGSIVEGNAGEYHRSTALASHAPGTTGAPWERVWPDGDGWTTEAPAGTPIPEWDAAVAYRPPAVVTHKGQTWDLVHTNSDPGWEPGVVPGVWAARV